MRAINRTRPEGEYGLRWRDLARVLGQPVPYWPYVLRDPDLIAAWQPGAPTVVVPARPDLDTSALLRMAAMFDPGHATHQTLLNLVRVVQDRATRDVQDDLRHSAEGVARFTDQVPAPTVVIAAEPLVIGEPDAEPDEIDATTRRIGWLELLPRTDTCRGSACGKH